MKFSTSTGIGIDFTRFWRKVDGYVLNFFLMFNSKFRLPAEAVPLVGKTLWNCEAGNIWFALGEPLHRPTRKMYQSRNEKTDKTKIFNTGCPLPLITPTAINPPSSPMCQCAYISSYTYMYMYDSHWLTDWRRPRVCIELPGQLKLKENFATSGVSCTKWKLDRWK